MGYRILIDSSCKSGRNPYLRLSENWFQCFRCKMIFDPKETIDKNKRFYCPFCKVVGPLYSDYTIKLITSEDDNKETVISKEFLTWSGSLTIAQSEISKTLVHSIETKKNQLVFATTGAGKTECTFEVIAEVLRRGGRVAICNPRVDVCNELFIRFQEAFVTTTSGMYHGKTESKWNNPAIAIMTVHQLIHFEDFFDLVIVDEFDAFPLRKNEFLLKQIKLSKKDTGTIILLSATFSLTQLVTSRYFDKNEISFLPARFHRRSLPQPKIYCGDDGVLIKHVENLQHLQRPILIFVPTIKEGKRLERKLKTFFACELVYAEDEFRFQKIDKFRKTATKILLTTSILERGVNFPNVLVIIWQAGHHNYTRASLVQISGRAGRSSKAQKEEVIMLNPTITWSMISAKYQIKLFNIIAKRRGLID